MASREPAVARDDPWAPTRSFMEGLDALRWDEWLSLFANRNEVAEEYASQMRQLGAGFSEWPGWREFNAAILRRWSPAGLAYIKERAWKIATQNL